MDELKPWLLSIKRGWSGNGACQQFSRFNIKMFQVLGHSFRLSLRLVLVRRLM